MTTRAFAVTYDYRCPFARNAHEHLLAAVDAGADWDVTYAPFSLSQAHVAEGAPPVWDDPAKAGDLLAIEASVVVRDHHVDQFPAVHEALFAARHDHGLDLRDEAVIRKVLADAGVDAEAVLDACRGGQPRARFRAEHEAVVDRLSLFGVPTFIVDDRAVFVRLMTRPAGDPAVSRAVIERVLDLLVDHPELNEFKHTTIAR